ncbi:MAG: molybdopterin-binding protein [bacterium]
MTRGMRRDRRRFLTRVAGLGGALVLAGCDRLSRADWFAKVLSNAEIVNRKLHHLLASRSSMAKEFAATDLSPDFPSNGTRQPTDPEYLRLAENHFREWRLEMSGLVERWESLSLDDLRELPSRTQITRHDCVEGWSAIAQWKGVRLSALLEKAGVRPQARYVVFFCFDAMEAGGAKYYESIDLEDAFHPQTLLAYEWNGQPLPVRYGAPLRLRLERQLGYKMAKYIRSIEVVERLDEIGEGRGGYWEDRGYEWYAGI